MEELGMKQWVTIKNEQVTPVNNVSMLEYRQGMGCWFNDVYEAKFMSNRDIDKLIIMKLDGKGLDSVIDNGKPYTWETAIIRLKELIKSQHDETT